MGLDGFVMTRIIPLCRSLRVRVSLVLGCFSRRPVCQTQGAPSGIISMSAVSCEWVHSGSGTQTVSGFMRVFFDLSESDLGIQLVSSAQWTEHQRVFLLFVCLFFKRIICMTDQLVF